MVVLLVRYRYYGAWRVGGEDGIAMASSRRRRPACDPATYLSLLFRGRARPVEKLLSKKSMLGGRVAVFHERGCAGRIRTLRARPRFSSFRLMGTRSRSRL
jgi:hypothetical protein